MVEQKVQEQVQEPAAAVDVNAADAYNVTIVNHPNPNNNKEETNMESVRYTLMQQIAAGEITPADIEAARAAAEAIQENRKPVLVVTKKDHQRTDEEKKTHDKKVAKKVVKTTAALAAVGAVAYVGYRHVKKYGNDHHDCNTATTESNYVDRFGAC